MSSDGWAIQVERERDALRAQVETLTKERDETIKDLRTCADDNSKLDELLEAAQCDLTRAREERDEAYGYLSRLFLHVHPQCRVQEKLIGLATQIDNAWAGLIERAAKADTERLAHAETRRQLERVKELAKPEHDLIAWLVKELQRIGHLSDSPNANISGALYGLVQGYESYRRDLKATDAERDRLREALTGLRALVKAEMPSLECVDIDKADSALSDGEKGRT